MLYLYTFLFYLILPFVFIRLFWRARKVPGYRERLKERLGYYDFSLSNCIWVHAVSMGETIAATPLIKSLQARYPTIPLLITCMTPTGAARIKTTFGDSVKQVYLPYDLPGAMNRFLNAMHPQIAVIIETELWPNMIAQCAIHHVPVCLMNARLSAKSARGYARIATLTKQMLSKLTLIAAHGAPDAQRFIELGAVPEIVSVTGNIKFDLELAAGLTERATSLRQMLGANRFIWVAASTHEGEEEIILATHQQIRVDYPDALLILVPRHPDRFDEIAKQCQAQFITKRRSLNETCDASTAVYLADTMGEMMLMYSVTDVAFVGGSLIPRGGHNILEPAALNKPIVVGPHLFNFKEISEMFFANDAAIKVHNQTELTACLKSLISDIELRKKMGEQAFAVMAANKGALQKQLDLLASIIKN